MNLNYAYLTRESWLEEDRLIESGTHTELNDVLNSKVYAQYLLDQSLIHKLNLSQRKKLKLDKKFLDQEKKVVVVSVFYEKGCVIAHLYFRIKGWRLFDVRTTQDKSISQQEKDDIIELVNTLSSETDTDPFAKNEMSKEPRFFSFLRLPTDLLTNITPFRLLDTGSSFSIFHTLKTVLENPVVERQELIITIPDGHTVIENNASSSYSLVHFPYTRARLKIGDSVTFDGQLSLPKKKVKAVGNNFKVTGFLVSDDLSIFKGTITCPELLISSGKRLLDFSQVHADKIVVYGATQKLHLKNTMNVKVMTLSPSSTQLGFGLTDFTLSNCSVTDLRIKECSVTLSPTVTVDNLEVRFKDCCPILNINGATVNKMILGNDCELITFLSVLKPVIQGDVVIRHKSVILDKGIVYGNLTVPKNFKVPASLNCLGEINYVEPDVVSLFN